MTQVRDLSSIFKAYDVRGVVPGELDERIAFAIGAAFARFARERTGGSRLLVGRDMRASGVELARALIEGATSVGSSVVDLGLASTDLVYFASGHLNAPGVMLTASHNPARYNGMKFCLNGATPVGEESGLIEVRSMAEALLSGDSGAEQVTTGSVESGDLLESFAGHVRSFIDVDRLSPLKVVADTANGMGGLIAPAVFSRLPVSLDVLYGELDGNFPNHPADPIQPENLVDLVAKVRAEHADVGLAFDGDADRVFLVDDAGELLSGSMTTAIVAKAMLEREPGSTVLYNCICSKVVRETIEECGGVGVRTRVGHSFIKQVMAETGAIFGGEHSGHYYFRDNFRADSGIIAALLVLQVLSTSNEPLSKLRLPFERYVDSGEINTEIADAEKTMERIKSHYSNLGAEIDELDGLTIDSGSWWFNLRASNTEPLLRLNVETKDAVTCAAKVQEVSDLMRADDK